MKLVLGALGEAGSKRLDAATDLLLASIVRRVMEKEKIKRDEPTGSTE